MNGTLLAVKIGTDGSEVIIDMQTECSFSLTQEVRDITSKGSAGFKESLPALRSGSITFSGLHAEDNTTNFADLFALVNTRAATHVLFGTAVTGDKTYEAEAYLTSCEMSAGTEDNVTISGTFELSGAITEATNA